MAIDTHLDATPSDITASATAIGTIKTNVDSAEDDLISARKSVCELEGSSAVAALSSLSTAVDGCEDLVTDLGDYKTALDNLASALSSIDTDLQGIRDQATAGGLTLNGETVVEPKSSYPLGANPDNSVEVYENSVEQDRISLYKNLETQTSDIRTREKEARQAFSDACAKIGTNPIAHAASNAVKGYFIPDTRAGGWVGAARAGTWGISRTRDIASLVEAAGLRASSANVTRTLKYTKYVTNRSANAGRHALRGITKTKDVVMEAGGKGTQQWRHALSDGKLSNWSPAKGMEGTVGAKAVDMARKAAPALKRAGRAGNVLSFGISAHEQWEKDSHNPSMGDGEKVARATTKGLGSAAGGWAGGLAGAKVGAAAGACIGGPVGAAVGGIVGGVVGGAIGSGVGGWVADQANKGIHSIAKWFH
mgnify:CR=1 FL=1